MMKRYFVLLLLFGLVGCMGTSAQSPSGPPPLKITLHGPVEAVQGHGPWPLDSDNRTLLNLDAHEELCRLNLSLPNGKVYTIDAVAVSMGLKKSDKLDHVGVFVAMELTSYQEAVKRAQNILSDMQKQLKIAVDPVIIKEIAAWHDYHDNKFSMGRNVKIEKDTILFIEVRHKDIESKQWYVRLTFDYLPEEKEEK